MQYGATNFPLRPLKKEIPILASLGFDYIELCLDPPEGDPVMLMAEAGEIKRILDGEGIIAAAGHLPTFVWLADTYLGVRQSSLDETIKALDACAEFGIPKAVLHPGYITGLMRYRKSKAWDYNMEALEKLVPAGRERGIVLCLENLFPKAGHMYRPEEFAEVLDLFPELMITFDLGHAHIQAPKDRGLEFVRLLGDRIRHVHISDNTGQDDEHLPVGVGRVDVAETLSALKKMGYQGGTMTLEVFAPDRDYLALSLKKVRAMWEAA